MSKSSSDPSPDSGSAADVAAKTDPPPQAAPALPVATPVRRRRLSLGWLLPVVGVGVIAYFAWWAHAQNQPNLTLEVANASGVKAFQTPVLCRGVEVGSVTDVTLKDQGGGAIVRIRLSREALRLATADASWWIKRPELSLTSIRGLEALLAGPSIEFLPGSESPAQRFTALERPPAEAGMSGGLRLYLHALDRGPVNEGTPIHFRGIAIGRVVALGLPTAGRQVVFVCEIERGYAHLIRENTVFWHREHARAEITPQALGLGGFRVELPRLNSALQVSLDAATPSDPGPLAEPGKVFDLQDAPPAEVSSWDPDLTPLVDPFPTPTRQQQEMQDQQSQDQRHQENPGTLRRLTDWLIFWD